MMTLAARPVVETRTCYSCNRPPVESFDAEFQAVVLQCPRDGHMAMGRDLDQATQHWNRYISFVLQVAYESVAELGHGRKTDESFCIYCLCPTQSRIVGYPLFHRVDCRSCGLPKWERPVVAQGAR